MGDADEDQLKEFFSECGNVVSIRIPADNRGKKKGHAYVEFDDDACVVKAIELSNKKELNGSTLVITRSIPMKDHKHHLAGARKDLPQHLDQKAFMAQKEKQEREANAVVSDTIFVKNLAFGVTEDGLK